MDSADFRVSYTWTCWTTDWKTSVEININDIIGLKIESVPWKDSDGFEFKHTLKVFTVDGSEYVMNHYCDALHGADRQDVAHYFRQLAFISDTISMYGKVDLK